MGHMHNGKNKGGNPTGLVTYTFRLSLDNKG